MGTFAPMKKKCEYHYLAALLTILFTQEMAAQTVTDSTVVVETKGADEGHKWIEGSFYTEANYGYNFYGERRNVYDFPHAVLEFTVNMGKGWSLSTEHEFEYLSEGGEWPRKFSEMYVCNYAYLQKEFSPGLAVRAGILNVPVGLTSSYQGSGLTVYDPVAESRILPLNWHEYGVAITGTLGQFGYWLGFVSHLSSHLEDDQSRGAAAKVDWMPSEGFRLGLAGFVGKGVDASVLSLSDDEDFELTTGRCEYLSLDFDLDKGRWIASGQAVWHGENGNVAVVAEAGYRATSWLTPFVHYDLLTMPHERDCHSATLGVNVEPLPGVCVKLQGSQEHSCTRVDMSVGYCLEF